MVLRHQETLQVPNVFDYLLAYADKMRRLKACAGPDIFLGGGGGVVGVVGGGSTENSLILLYMIL